MNDGPALHVSGLTVVRGGRELLAGVSLDVERGAWVAVIGPNGAGKSTLLGCLSGTVGHDGHVEVDGRDMAHLKPRERARMVAVVPQHPSVPPGMSVVDYVLLGRTPHIPILGVESADDREVVVGLLDRLDLTDLTDRELATLSGGERQRAVMARALAQQAPVLLLDEPTTGLDIGHQQEVLELVDELRAEHGLTVVSAMHDLTLAGQHGDRFALLSGGRFVADGTAAEVLRADLLAEVFGAHVEVLDSGEGPVIIPRRRSLVGRSR